MKLGKPEEESPKATFDEIYKKTYPVMFNLVRKKYANGDYDLARDYCQIGYIRISANFHKYSGKGKIEGWVGKILKNTIINEIRKRKLDIDQDFNFERNEIEDIPYSEDWMGESITTDDIMEAIEDLPEVYKRVLILHYFEGKSFDEIGEILKTHSGTQRGYIFRARNMIRKKLEKIINHQSRI